MQTRAIEVTNNLLKKALLFIDAMSVHLQLKCSQIYKNIFFTLMINLQVFVTIVTWAFIRQETYQLIY